MSTVDARELSYSNFDEVLKTVAVGLWNAIRLARGTCISFTPKKILEYANVANALPVVLTLVKHVLEELARRNLIVKDTSRTVVRYKVCKFVCRDDECKDYVENELWALCKESQDHDRLLKLVRAIVE